MNILEKLKYLIIKTEKIRYESKYFDPSLSESENMLNNKVYKKYDYRKLRFIREHK